LSFICSPPVEAEVVGLVTIAVSVLVTGGAASVLELTSQLRSLVVKLLLVIDWFEVDEVAVDVEVQLEVVDHDRIVLQ
jgi:hypothetical protein